MLYESASGDLVGWLLAATLVISSALIATITTRSSGAFIAFVLAVLTRVVLSALSSYDIFLPPDSDRLDFHIQAAQIATSDGAVAEVIIGHQIYALILSFFYQLLGTSIFLGCMISLVPFIGSLVYLLKIIKLWGLEKFETPVLLLYGFAPGMLLYANFTYREPIQILCMIMALYYGVLYRRNASFMHLLGCTMSLFVFGLLHAKFMVVVPLILALAILWPGVRNAHNKHGARLFASFPLGILVVGISIVTVFSQSEGNVLIDALSTGNVSEYMLDMKYTMQGISPRTLLPVQLEGSSFWELAYKSPLILFQYMFAPLFPWLVQQPQDLVALADTTLRSLLLLSAVRTARQMPPQFRNEANFLLVVYLVVSLVAALGTAAVGTAIRHQIKVSWILILLGGPGLFQMLGLSNKRLRQPTNPI